MFAVCHKNVRHAQQRPFNILFSVTVENNPFCKLTQESQKKIATPLPLDNISEIELYFKEDKPFRLLLQCFHVQPRYTNCHWNITLNMIQFPSYQPFFFHIPHTTQSKWVVRLCIINMVHIVWHLYAWFPCAWGKTGLAKVTFSFLPLKHTFSIHMQSSSTSGTRIESDTNTHAHLSVGRRD